MLCHSAGWLLLHRSPIGGRCRGLGLDFRLVFLDNALCGAVHLRASDCHRWNVGRNRLPAPEQRDQICMQTLEQSLVGIRPDPLCPNPLVPPKTFEAIAAARPLSGSRSHSTQMQTVVGKVSTMPAPNWASGSSSSGPLKAAAHAYPASSTDFEPPLIPRVACNPPNTPLGEVVEKASATPRSRKTRPHQWRDANPRNAFPYGSRKIRRCRPIPPFPMPPQNGPEDGSYAVAWGSRTRPNAADSRESPLRPTSPDQ